MHFTLKKSNIYKVTQQNTAHTGRSECDECQQALKASVELTIRSSEAF